MNRTALWKHKPYTVYDSSGPPPYTPPANSAVLASQDFADGAAWFIRTGLTSVLDNAQDQFGTPNLAATFLFSAGASARNTLGPGTTGTYTLVGCFAKIGVAGCGFMNISTNGNADYATFNLATGAVAANGGTGTGAIFPAANGFYWCQVTFSGAEIQSPQWNFGNTAAHALPGVASTLAGTETVIAYNPICRT